MEDNKGFTLLEVLAVIAIIGIMAAMIAPKVAGHVVEAKEKVCLANIQYLEGVMERYKMAKGDYPTTLTNLNEFHKEPYPVSPRSKIELENGQTGYYFSPTTGKVSYNPDEKAGLQELTNPIEGGT